MSYLLEGICFLGSDTREARSADIFQTLNNNHGSDLWLSQNETIPRYANGNPYAVLLVEYEFSGTVSFRK